MPDRVIPITGHDRQTHCRILDTATEMFALKGFEAVSMRDIAKAVGIKMSSIYHYYEGKEALIADVLSRFEAGYRHYFDWLADLNSETDSIEDLVDNMFNAELEQMRDPLGCLGISLALKAQHNNGTARNYVYQLFYDFSIERLKADFDRLVSKGAAPPTDTKTIATLLMLCVMAINDIKVHEYTGMKPPINAAEVCAGMKKIIKLMLTTNPVKE
ncbi:MAG: TetR/AcrR family transcriptional regulator [Oscillospiraceae bacterium]|nr:TetR/AcrR family transcriptional regulator [Oscillospiraceae bacterium]